MEKGILIDVVNRSVTEVMVTKDNNGSSLPSMYGHLRCEMIEVVSFFEQDDIYVDEEGLYRTENYNNGFFMFEGMKEPISGNGLILGIDHETGETKDTTLSVEYVREKVEFLIFIPTPKNNGFFFKMNKDCVTENN
jgi:hypothetical protein